MCWTWVGSPRRLEMKTSVYIVYILIIVFCFKLLIISTELGWEALVGVKEINIIQ